MANKPLKNRVVKIGPWHTGVAVILEVQIQCVIIFTGSRHQRQGGIDADDMRREWSSTTKYIVVIGERCYHLWYQGKASYIYMAFHLIWILCKNRNRKDRRNKSRKPSGYHCRFP